MMRWLAIIAVFRRGAMVADPTTWKNRQIAINAMVGLVSAAAVAAAQMGWIPDAVATETIQQFGEGMALAALAIINILGTAATSRKVGVGPRPPMPEPNDAELFDAEPMPADRYAFVSRPDAQHDRSAAAAGRADWLGD